MDVQDDEETAEFALDGLKQVMAVKSRSVLPYLVPKVNCSLVLSHDIMFVLLFDRNFFQLTSPPVNTRVLAFLSAVTGDALTRHLGAILPALLSSLKEKLGTDEGPQVSLPSRDQKHFFLLFGKSLCTPDLNKRIFN